MLYFPPKWHRALQRREPEGVILNVRTGLETLSLNQKNGGTAVFFPFGQPAEKAIPSSPPTTSSYILFVFRYFRAVQFGMYLCVAHVGLQHDVQAFFVQPGVVIRRLQVS